MWRGSWCIESSPELGYSMFNWQLSNVQPSGGKESHERADWKEGEGRRERGGGGSLWDNRQVGWGGLRGGRDSMGREGEVPLYLCGSDKHTHWIHRGWVERHLKRWQFKIKGRKLMVTVTRMLGMRMRNVGEWVWQTDAQTRWHPRHPFAPPPTSILPLLSHSHHLVLPVLILVHSSNSHVLLLSTPAS